jgi:hypothetical protein
MAVFLVAAKAMEGLGPRGFVLDTKFESSQILRFFHRLTYDPLKTFQVTKSLSITSLKSVTLFVIPVVWFQMSINR